MPDNEALTCALIKMVPPEVTLLLPCRIAFEEDGSHQKMLKLYQFFRSKSLRSWPTVSPRIKTDTLWSRLRYSKARLASRRCRPATQAPPVYRLACARSGPCKRVPMMVCFSGRKGVYAHEKKSKPL